MPLEDFLQFTPLSVEAGSSPLQPPTRPTKAGLKWLATAAGSTIFYRYAAGQLQACELDDAGSVRVLHSVETDPVVNVAASADGRLVAACCADGSLRCHDATAGGSLAPRWTIEGAHSHVVADINDSCSSDRAHAAGAAGPARSLAFSPENYALCLVDDGQEGLTLYNADDAGASPTERVGKQLDHLHVACAAWSPVTDGTTCTLAIGTSDGGSIHIYKVDTATSELTWFNEILYPGEDAHGWSCTHLDWFERGTTLAAGYCRVIPSEEEEDEDGEDDAAEHEAALYMIDVDLKTCTAKDETDMGDLVPFFSIPKHGRHVFFTAATDTSQPETVLLLVASNVGSDIALIAKEEAGPWTAIEVPEGSNVTTPTDEEDEFTYPLGLSVLHVPAAETFTKPVLLLPSTDGTLSAFNFVHGENENFFNVQRDVSSSLPSDPVPVSSKAAAVAPPPLAVEPPAAAIAEPESAKEEETGKLEASGFSFPPAKTEQPAFGSGAFSFATATPFGQPLTTSPFSIASADKSESKTTPSLFRKPSTGGATATAPTSVFGQTSPLGSSAEKSSSALFGQTSSLFGPPSTPKTPEPAVESTNFGSGTSAPVFGSGTKAPSFGTFGALAAAASSPAAEQSSPFDAFAKRTASPPTMAKPLFTTPATAEKGKAATPSAAEPNKQEEAKDGVEKEMEVPAPATGPEDLGDNAQKAAKVFDSMDKEKAGVVPTSCMEALVDELGEGYSAQELQDQIALIDLESSGQLQRSAFIAWYINLTKVQESKDDASSLDTAEREEREEEQEKARKSFMTLAREENGSYFITAKDFPALLESLDTTYCEEDHGQKFKRLVKPDGKLFLDVFLDWYVDWLFGGDESSIEEEPKVLEEEAKEEDKKAAESASEEKERKDWGDLFTKKDGTWKCETCRVDNVAAATKCAACETPRPGQAETSDSAALTFGSGSIGAGSFTFGGPAAVEAHSTSPFTVGTMQSSGFSFGSGEKTSTPGGFFFGTSATSVSEQKKEETEEPAFVEEVDVSSESRQKAAHVFDSMDENKVGILPTSCIEALVDELGEGYSAQELQDQIALIDPEGSGLLHRSAFIAWYVNLTKAEEKNEASSLETAERQEREEEREKARERFMSLAEEENGSCFITTKDFPTLLESLDTTYCEEDHGQKFKSLVKSDGKLFLDVFLDWYVDWLFGGDESSVEEEPGEKEEEETAAESKDWGDMFAKKDGTWKCETCMVDNVATATKCAACETPHPGQAATSDDKESGSAAPAFGLGSIGAGGFTFGGPAIVETDSTSPFSFGTTLSKESTSPGAATGGFLFGSKVADSGSAGFTFDGAAAKPSSSEVTLEREKSVTAGDVSSKAETSAPSLGSAYPPLAEKAPTPFSAQGKPAAEPKKEKPASSAYPPLATKAPTPFSAQGKPAAEPRTEKPASSAYPPLAGKAPMPFSAEGQPATKSKKEKPASSAYPPLAMEAPTPFSAGKPSAESKKEKPTSSAYPPLAMKAPTPFSAQGKPAAEPKKDKPASSAYPPLAGKAPTPFSAQGRSAAERKQEKPASSAYPPLSMKAPAPVGSRAKVPPPASGYPPLSAKAPTPFSPQVTLATEHKTKASTSFMSPPSYMQISPKELSKKGLSECCAEFIRLVDRFNETMNTIARGRCQGIERDLLREEIGHLNEDVGYAFLGLGEVTSLTNLCKRQLVSVSSRKVDAARKVDDAKNLIELLTSKDSDKRMDIILNQPLDSESEQRRRQLTASALLTKRLIEMAKSRYQLLHSLDQVGGDRMVLRNILQAYIYAKGFEEVPREIEQKLSELPGTFPTSRSPLSRSALLLDSRRKGVSTASSTRRKSELLWQTPPNQKWQSIDQSFQQLQLQRVKIKIFDLDTAAPTMPGDSTKLSRATSTTSRSIEQKSRSMFSPALTPQARPAWDKVSTVDQMKMKRMTFSSPSDLKETTMNRAARDALSDFGTTPEKVKDALDVNKRGSLSPARSAALPSDTKAASANSSQKVDSSAKKATALKKTSAAFPPLSAKAPTPVSKQLGKPVTEKSPAKPSTPPSPSFAPPTTSKVESARASEGKIDVIKDEKQGVPSFGMSTLGGSLFSLSKASSVEEARPTGFAGISGLGGDLLSPPKPLGESKTEAAITPSIGSTPDYHKLLTDFYQVYNPSKVPDVAKHLEKYKGREADMFAKLAAKYKAPNPLDSQPTKTLAPAPATAGFGGSAASPFSPAPATAEKPPLGLSPFGSPSGLAEAQSPFGISMSTTAPVPAFGASPFGQAASSVTSPQFGGMSQLGSSPTQPTPMTPAPAIGESFAGRPPRDMLFAFYQKYNPSKVAEVDRLLLKYQGKEEQMFRNLAKKYNLDPAVFGLPSTPVTGFGAAPPSAAGVSPGFGQTSSLGGGPTFGMSPPTSTFGGAPSSQGFGASPAPSHVFGAGAGGGVTSFGSLAQAPGSSPGFSSFVGAPPPGPFGNSSPFGAPRR